MTQQPSAFDASYQQPLDNYSTDPRIINTIGSSVPAPVLFANQQITLPQSLEIEREKRANKSRNYRLTITLITAVPLSIIGASAVSPALLGLLITWLGIAVVVIASGLLPNKDNRRNN